MTRTIRTAAELDALPVGSVVRGTAFEYGPAATIYVRQEEFWYAGWGVDEEAYFDLPVVVLHDPSAPAPAPSVVPEAAPSATREEVARTLDIGGWDTPVGLPDGPMASIRAYRREGQRQAADRLLARFTITPKEDR